MPKTRPAYPEEFRQEAVAMVRGGRSVRDVAESLGVSQQSLRKWVKQIELDGRERDDGLRSEERGAAPTPPRERPAKARARGRLLR
jgi:transposase